MVWCVGVLVGVLAMRSCVALRLMTVNLRMKRCCGFPMVGVLVGLLGLRLRQGLGLLVVVGLGCPSRCGGSLSRGLVPISPG